MNNQFIIGQDTRSESKSGIHFLRLRRTGPHTDTFTDVRGRDACRQCCMNALRFPPRRLGIPCHLIIRGKRPIKESPVSEWIQLKLNLLAKCQARIRVHCSNTVPLPWLTSALNVPVWSHPGRRVLRRNDLDQMTCGHSCPLGAAPFPR